MPMTLDVCCCGLLLVSSVVLSTVDAPKIQTLSTAGKHKLDVVVRVRVRVIIVTIALLHTAILWRLLGHGGGRIYTVRSERTAVSGLLPSTIIILTQPLRR